MKKNHTFDILILAIFVFSKFFYFSFFQINSMNFTLSDFLLLIMLFKVTTSRIKINRDFLYVFIISIFILFLLVVGGVLNNTRILSSLIMYVKRWFSFLIIPFFIYNRFNKKDGILISYIIMLIVISFAIVNYNVIISSIQKDRFFDTFNPNILGVLASILFIYFLSFLQLKENLFLILTTITTLIICLIIIFSVASRGAMLAFIPSFLFYVLFSLKKLTIKKVLCFLIILIIIVISFNFIIETLKIIFPYSMNRLIETIRNGVLNDNSVSARLTTQFLLMNNIINEVNIFIFGTGFGNLNMFEYFMKLGMSIQTADNQYLNIFAWSGLLGLISYLIIFYLLIFGLKVRKIKNLKNFYAVSFCMLIAGLTTDTFTEPTLGSVYLILYSLTILELSGGKNENTNSN